MNVKVVNVFKNPFRMGEMFFFMIWRYELVSCQYISLVSNVFVHYSSNRSRYHMKCFGDDPQEFPGTVINNEVVG